MLGHLGFYNTSSSRTHVRFQFATFAAAGGNVAPSSAFEAADLRIYRAADGAAFSATQRSSANGITMTSPFDSLTGLHDVDIDLTDNTDAGFYASGYLYSVVLSPDETVDSQTLTGVVLAYFEIGALPVNVTQFGGSAGTFSSGRPEVNATHFGGSAGTFSSGRPEVNTTHIDGSSGAVNGIWAKALSDLAAVPSATASVLAGLNWLFMLGRNRFTQNRLTGDSKLYKDNGSTVVATSNATDNGTTLDRGEYS